MNCPSVEDLLAFTEGSLGGPERERVERHVEECPRCRAIVEVERRLAHAAAAGLGKRSGVADRPILAGRGRIIGKHPDEIDLARFVEGALDESRREAFLGHVAECADCRAAVSDYARELRDLEAGPVPPALLKKGLALGTSRAQANDSLAKRLARFLFPSSEGLTAWLRPAAALACVLVAVVLVPRLFRNPGEGPDEGGIRDGTDGGRPVTTLPAGDTLSRVDLAAGRVPFGWTAIPGATKYRAVIAGDDGTVLLEASTTEARWSPRLDVDRLARTDRIVFWVEASTGGQHAASATRTYALR